MNTEYTYYTYLSYTYKVYNAKPERNCSKPELKPVSDVLLLYWPYIAAILLPVEWFFEKALSIVPDRTERERTKWEKSLSFTHRFLRIFFFLKKPLEKTETNRSNHFHNFIPNHNQYAFVLIVNYLNIFNKLENSNIRRSFVFRFFSVSYQPTHYYPPKYAFFAKYSYFELIVSFGRTEYRIGGIQSWTTFSRWVMPKKLHIVKSMKTFGVRELNSKINVWCTGIQLARKTLS